MKAIPEQHCMIVSESKAKIKKVTRTNFLRKTSIDNMGTWIYLPIPKTYTLGYSCTKTVKVEENI